MHIRWDTHELSVPIVARSSVLSERASSFAVPVTHGARLRSLTLPNVRLTETQHAGHVRLPRHAHSHAAITFVLDGAFTETFGSTTHMCGPLALLFKPAHAEHVNAYASEGARSFIIEPLSQMTNELALFESLEHHTPQRGAACLAPLALQLYARFRREDGDLAFECEELALRLVAAAPAPLPGATRRAPAWLRDIEEMLRREPEQRWSLAALGALAGVHPVYLARVFRQHFGMSIGTHVRRSRVTAAIGRLAAPACRPAQTAYTLGFSDQSHFGRAFRRETGRSPTQYQKDLASAGIQRR